MNATQQKKLSGELQADLQALLDDALNELNESRKERDEAQAKCAETRDVLIKIKETLHCGCTSGSFIYGCTRCRIKKEAIEPALSTDCGKGWMRVTELEKTIEILKHLSSFKATWVNMTIDPEIERLTKLMEAQ